MIKPTYILFFLLSLLWIPWIGFAQAPVRLSLREAIELSFQKNLNVLLSAERENEAHGRELQALAPLFPNLYATASDENITQNLAATGFPLKSFPVAINPLIGPYYNFDARLQLAQTLFNLSAYRKHQASQVDFQVAGLQKELAREQVATATTVAYLNVLTLQKATEAASSNVDLAKSLTKLARDQRDAGVATGVDVARAETRLAAQTVNLAQTQTALETALFQFNRIIGIPLASELMLTDSISYASPGMMPLDTLLSQALKERIELKIADEELRLNNYSVAAARDEGIPSFNFSANYGESGNAPGILSLPTRAFMIKMNLPVFNGELTAGHILEAESRRREALLTRNDTYVQVEQDVRLATQTLLTTAKAVESANESVRLAERELELSRDRFQSGLGDNVEVIAAETALENARNAQVGALADYNRARVNLAAALGEAQKFDFRSNSGGSR